MMSLEEIQRRATKAYDWKEFGIVLGLILQMQPPPPPFHIIFIFVPRLPWHWYTRPLLIKVTPCLALICLDLSNSYKSELTRACWQ